MRTLGVLLVVFIQTQNGFKGFMAIEADIIVDGHRGPPVGVPLRELYAWFVSGVHFCDAAGLTKASEQFQPLRGNFYVLLCVRYARGV